MTFFYSASNCWQLPRALKTNSCTNPGAGLFAVHSLPARRSRRFVDALSKQTATKNTGSRQGPSVGSERFRWSWITYTLQPVANTLTPYNIIPCQPRCALRKRTDDVCLVLKTARKFDKQCDFKLSFPLCGVRTFQSNSQEKSQWVV